MFTNVVSEKVIYFGGAHKKYMTTCFKLRQVVVSEVLALRCDHKEADDSILFHISNSIQVGQCKRKVVASSDTDVLVALLYHYRT